MAPANIDCAGKFRSIPSLRTPVGCAKLSGHTEFCTLITCGPAAISNRLIVYSSEGLPWVFSPTEWLPEESDRITLIQLADVLSNQVGNLYEFQLAM